MYINLRKPDGVRAEKYIVENEGHKIPLLVLSPESRPEQVPGVLWIHGGGYITGLKEMIYMSRGIDLVTKHGAVVVSPDYRLALRHPYPAAVNDCYAALLWMKENAESLGIRTDQIMAGGESAGGGLTAAVCMMARDRKEVQVAYQMPLYPMIDNFDTSTSENNHGKVWNTRRNHFGWKSYLRDGYQQEVSPYASPARQTDFTELPPCYTFVGDGEPFCQETLDYVESLKKAGVEAVAEVYHSDTHAFDMLYPEREESRKATESFNQHFAYAMTHYFKPQK